MPWIPVITVLLTCIDLSQGRYFLIIGLLFINMSMDFDMQCEISYL
jgi:hypothetical protein